MQTSRHLYRTNQGIGIIIMKNDEKCNAKNRPAETTLEVNLELSNIWNIGVQLAQPSDTHSSTI